MGPEPVLVGRVARAHGLTGEVAVEVVTDFPGRFVPGARLLLREGAALRPVVVSSVRWHGDRLLMRLEGIADRDGADRLRGAELLVDEAQLAPRPPGFVYHFEVEGCTAVARDGSPLGVVRALQEVAGRHLLVLETARGERDVPFVEPIVVSVDLEARRVTLDPPEGLLE